MRGAKTVAGLSVGAAAAAVLWRTFRTKPASTLPPQSQRPRIVVAGAGFGGISALTALAEEIPADYADVTLVDRNNYHLFTPLLYQVATGAVDSTSLTYSLRRFCAQLGFRFICSEIHGVNPVDQVLTTEAGQIPYDYLVMGLGSQTNYFGMDEVQERSFGLKSIPDAVVLHRRIIQNFERAAVSKDPEERKKLLTFIVVGGGATGIELIGSLHDLVQNSLIRYYPEITSEETRIMLIEASDHVLPGINPKLGKMALKRFEELGIDVQLNTRVAGVRDGFVITRDETRISGDVIVWTAGIRPNPVTAGLALEKARDGRLLVDEHLRVRDMPTMFAIGDSAASIDPESDQPLPPNAAVAVQEGEHVGTNLARLMRGEPLLPFDYEPIGELIALGRLRAAAELGPFVFNGLIAWIIWRVVYLTKIMGVKNRAKLVLDWFASLIGQRNVVDIEGDN